MARAIGFGSACACACRTSTSRATKSAFNEIVFRDGKGAIDRIILLPDAIDRKYPNAAKERLWQWVMPHLPAFLRHAFS